VTIPDKRYYRPDELADIFCLNIKTVYKMMQDGRIKNIHVGHSKRIPTEEVRRIEAEGIRAK
jgi:excisionase family DNA binding protein